MGLDTGGAEYARLHACNDAGAAPNYNTIVANGTERREFINVMKMSELQMKREPDDDILNDACDVVDQ